MRLTDFINTNHEAILTEWTAIVADMTGGTTFTVCVPRQAARGALDRTPALGQTSPRV